MDDQEAKLLEEAKQASSADALKRDQIKDVLGEIESHAERNGFGAGAISDMIELIVDIQKRCQGQDALSRQDKNVLMRMSVGLIKALWPAGSVPDTAVIRLLGPMLSFNHSMQLECLHWLALVFDQVQCEQAGREPKWECAAFNICFFLLVFDTLRPAACYLLCRLVKSHHATNFRVRHLQSIQGRVGVERELTALLVAFKRFNQAVVIRGKHRRSDAVFRNPCRARWDKVNLMRAQAGKPPVLYQGDVSGSKGSKSSLSARSMQQLPSASVPQKSVIGKRIGQQTHTINTIADVSRALLWANAENAPPPLPSQMISAVTSRPLLHTLQLYRSLQVEQSRYMVARVSEWLHFRLVESSKKGDTQLGEVLGVLQYLTVFLQEMPAPLEDWLHRFLCGWDGRRHRDAIFEVMSRLRPMPFETLYWSFLKPLHPLLASGDAELKAAVLRCLCDMFTGYARFDWLSITHIQSQKADESPFHLGPLTFEGIELGVDYPRTIRSLLVYANSVCSMALLQHPDSLLVQHEALCLQEEMSRLWTRYALPFLVPPPVAVVYTCLLSSSSMACSRMCGVLSMIKTEIEKLRPSRRGADDFQLSFPSGLDDDSIKRLNSFILDFCNALWRSRLGEEEKKNAQGPHWPFFTDGVALRLLSARCPGITQRSVFSITKLVSFAACVHNFLGTKGRTAMRDDMKPDFLEYLNKCGYVGAYDFIYTFIASFERLRRQKGVN